MDKENFQEDNDRKGERLRGLIFQGDRSFINIQNLQDEEIFSQILGQNSQREHINQMLQEKEMININKLVLSEQNLKMIEINNNNNDKIEYELKDLNKVWKKKAFSILKHIKKFILQIKLRTNQLRFKEMTQQQFAIIDDKSCYWKYYRDKGMLINIRQNKLTVLIQNCSEIVIKHILFLKYVKQFSKFLPWNVHIISPDSAFKITWDILILILNMLNVLFIPLQISNQEHNQSEELINMDQSHIIFEVLCCFLFLLDLLLHFNTALYKKGDIIEDRTQIARHLLKKGGILWELAIIALYALSIILEFPYLSLVVLGRCSKIKETMNSLIEKCSFQSNQLALFDLGKLIMLIFFISHVCACGFVLMHKLETVYQLEHYDNSASSIKTWATLNSQDMNADSMTDLYVSALYWAIITMITVGYGDFHPVNNVEKIVIIVMTVLSCGVFAFAVNQVGQIIEQITKKGAIFKAKMALLATHMKRKGLSFNLQMKVKKYFEYLHKENIEEDRICEEMIMQLPSSLKHEVLNDTNRKILFNLKLFTFNFSPDFLNELSLRLREKRCFAEEVIFAENQQNDNIYFVQKGDILLNVKSSHLQEQEEDNINFNNKASILLINNNNESNLIQNNNNINNNNNQENAFVLNNKQYQYNRFLSTLSAKRKKNAAISSSNSNKKHNKLIKSGSSSSQQLNTLQQQYAVTRHLKKGDSFNELSFFSEQPTHYEAVSKNLALVYFLKREDFLSLAKRFPKDFQVFFMLKDRINSYKEYRGLESQCIGCKKFTHQIESCPYTKYLPQPEKVIYKYNSEGLSFQPRSSSPFKRKNRKNVHALLDQDEIQQQVLQYICSSGDEQMMEQAVERLKLCFEEFQNVQKRFTQTNFPTANDLNLGRESVNSIYGGGSVKRQSMNSVAQDPTLNSLYNNSHCSQQQSHNNNNSNSKNVIRSNSLLQKYDDMNNCESEASQYQQKQNDEHSMLEDDIDEDDDDDDDSEDNNKDDNYYNQHKEEQEEFKDIDLASEAHRPSQQQQHQQLQRKQSKLKPKKSLQNQPQFLKKNSLQQQQSLDERKQQQLNCSFNGLEECNIGSPLFCIKQASPKNSTTIKKNSALVDGDSCSQKQQQKFLQDSPPSATNTLNNKNNNQAQQLLEELKQQSVLSNNNDHQKQTAINSNHYLDNNSRLSQRHIEFTENSNYNNNNNANSLQVADIMQYSTNSLQQKTNATTRKRNPVNRKQTIQMNIIELEQRKNITKLQHNQLQGRASFSGLNSAQGNQGQQQGGGSRRSISNNNNSNNPKFDGNIGGGGSGSSYSQHRLTDNDEIDEQYIQEAKKNYVDDIDKLCNWDYYFPHNNYVNLNFPQKWSKPVIKVEDIKKANENKLEEMLLNFQKPNASPMKKRGAILLNNINNKTFQFGPQQPNSNSRLSIPAQGLMSLQQ